MECPKIFTCLISKGANDSVEDFYGELMYNKFIVRDELKYGFIVFDSRSDFIIYMDSLPEDRRCFHEVIFGCNNQRLKFDIDIKPSKDIQRDDIIQIINIIITKIIDTFNVVYDKGDVLPESLTKKKHIIVTESNKENKYSYHIIIRGFSVENNIEAKYFTALLKETLEIRHKHILISDLIDDVNSRIQNFRIIGCTKKGAARPKLLSTTFGTCMCNESDTFIQFNTTDILLKQKVCKKKQNDITDEIDSIKVGEILRICYEKIPDMSNYEYRSCTKNMINFNRISGSSHCSICSTVHDKENAMVVLYLNHTIYQVCRRNNFKTKVQIHVFDVPKEEKITRACRLKNTLTSTKLDNTDPMWMYSNSNVYESPTLNDISHTKTLYINAPMKIGKTKKLKQFIDKLDPTASICILSFRIFFSTHIHTMFEEEENPFILYKTIKGDISPSTYKRVIIQVESLHRLKGVYDYVILDESESILSQFDSGNMMNMSFAIAHFTNLMKNAKQVICMDAFMSKRTIDVIRSMRGEDGEVIEINKHMNATEYTYNVTYSEIDFIRNMNKSIDGGKKIVVVSNKLSKLNELHELITKHYPTLKTVLYSSKSDPSIKRDHMKDINTTCVKYDVMLYSPTLTAGVSIEVDHFHEIYGYFTNVSCDAMTCMQMLGRVRNVKDKLINICFNTIPSYCSTNISSIEKDVCEGRLELIHGDINNLNVSVNQDAIMNNIRYSVCKNDYYIVWIHNQMAKNISKTHFEKLFLQYVIMTGADIKIYEDDNRCIYSHKTGEYVMKPLTEEEKIEYKKQKSIVLSSISIAKETYKQKEATDIYNAPDVDHITYQKLIEKSTYDDTITMKEINMIDKHQFKSFYNVGTLTITMIKTYNTNMSKRWYRNLRDILSCDSIEASLKKLQVVERIKMKEYMDSTITNDLMYEPKYEYHISVYRLVCMIGFVNIFDDTKLPISVVEDNLKMNAVDIMKICKKFKKYPIVNIRTLSGITTDMYGYAISKKGVDVFIKEKHKFNIQDGKLCLVDSTDIYEDSSS